MEHGLDRPWQDNMSPVVTDDWTSSSCVPLLSVHFLLLVHAQLPRTHVDEKEESAAVGSRVTGQSRETIQSRRTEKTLIRRTRRMA